jgi:RNA 2',3'-cyclic 3'-phosphodiesterase
MPTIRTFIAISTSTEVQQHIAELQTKLKETQADVKWDSQNKFHITLKFLGNVEESKLELLSAEISKAIQPFSQFTLEYESLGVFPNIYNPSIVWIGIKPNQVISDLQSAIETICLECGFSKESRAFHPHITLGRVHGNRNLVYLTDAIKTITFEPIKSLCSEVLLMKSNLLPSGSVYSILKSFPFNS